MRKLRSLLIKSDPYLSCDDCFEQVNEAVEQLISKKEKLSPEFKTHLAACGACHEEAEALAELIADQYGMTPEEAVSALTSDI